MFLKTRLITGQRQNNKRIKAKGQASLELAASFICILLLLWASFKVFLWVTERFVVRQEDYEASRVSAGDYNPGVEVNESNVAKYPRLNVFVK